MCLLVSRTKFGDTFKEEEKTKMLLDDRIDHRVCFKPTETTDMCKQKPSFLYTSSLGKQSQLCFLSR